MIALVCLAGAAAWWFLIKPQRDTSPQDLGPAPRLIEAAPQIAAASDLSQKVAVSASLSGEIEAEPGSQLSYYSGKPMEITLGVTRSERGAAYELGAQLTGDPFEVTLLSSEREAYAELNGRWYELAGSLIPSDSDVSPLSFITPESVGGFLTHLGALGLSAQGETVTGPGGGELYRYEIQFDQPRVTASALARQLSHGHKRKYVEERRQKMVDQLAPLLTHGDVEAAITVYANSYALESIEISADVPQRDLAPIFSAVKKPRNTALGESGASSQAPSRSGGAAGSGSGPPAKRSAPIDPLRPFVSGDGLQRLQLGLSVHFSGWGRDHQLPEPGSNPLSAQKLRELLFKISPTLLIPTSDGGAGAGAAAGAAASGDAPTQSP